MRRLRILLTAFAGLSLAIASIGCDGELSGLIPVDSVPLNTSSDPGVRAAGDSSDAIDKVRKAESLLQQGLTTNDPAKLSEAVRIRPDDPSLRYYQSAMLIAKGDEEGSTKAFEEGDGVIQRKYGRWSSEQTAEAAPLWLDALSVTLTKFPKDSEEWRRLNTRYCAELRFIRTVQFIRINSIYPDESCK
jgi:hypothetical protein